jgi:hypothetical protein
MQRARGRGVAEAGERSAAVHAPAPAAPPGPPPTPPGLEVGHYAGCARAWRALQALAPGAIPEKAERGIAALEGLAAEYPR